MPNTNTAKKRLRQDAKRRQRNRAAKTRMKTFSKKIVDAAEAGKTDDAQEHMHTLQEIVDKAAKSGAIHRNKAARRKSRMQKRINAAKQSGAS